NLLQLIQCSRKGSVEMVHIFLWCVHLYSNGSDTIVFLVRIIFVTAGPFFYVFACCNFGIAIEETVMSYGNKFGRLILFDLRNHSTFLAILADAHKINLASFLPGPLERGSRIECGCPLIICVFVF